MNTAVRRYIADDGVALTADVGLLYYVYPGGSFGDGNVFEPYASLTAAIGPATAKSNGNVNASASAR